MENKENKSNSKQILLSVLGVAILVVAVVGISFAAFTYSKAGETVNTISTGTITMSYDEATNGIDIENAVPTADADGMVLSADNEKFDFTVTAKITGSTTINYEVVAVKANDADADVSTLVPDANIRLYLESSTDGTSYSQVFAPAAFTGITTADDFGAPVGSMVLANSSFTTADGSNSGIEQKVYYRLRMWVDETYVVSGVAQSYKVKVNVYGKGTN